MLLTKRWLGGPSSAQEAKPAARAADEAPAEEAKAKPKRAKEPKAGEESAKTEKSGRKKQRAEAPAEVAAAGPEAEEEDGGDVADAMSLADKAAAAKAKAKAAKRRRKKKKKQDPKVMKDPEAAAAYLHAWEAQQDGGEGDSGGSQWRFNKATQAWLLRHAYEPEKVPKDVFRLLLRYLEGLKGGARDRLREEASAVVTLRGAPLSAAAPEASAEPMSEKAKKKAARRAASLRGQAGDAAPADGEGTAAAGDAPPAGGDGGTPGEAQAELSEADAEAEAKARKMRLRRAKQVLGAIGGLDDEAEEGEA